MALRIAMISEHASPLGAPGGVDAGGQNVYVAQLARRLACAGHHVDVFTRRDCRSRPELVEWAPRVRVINVPAGPASFVAKEKMLPHMAEFTEYVLDFMRSQRQRYDLVHANFFMSGLVAADIKRATGIPFVVTFHALGRVRRLHQGGADGFPDDRFAIEDRIVAEADRVIAECPQEQEDLILHYRADPARVVVVPCGFDAEEIWPIDQTLARAMLGIEPEDIVVLQLGRMVQRKGIEDVLRGFAQFANEVERPARLLIVGGESDEPDPERTPEIGRLSMVAEELGILDAVTFTGRKSRDALKYYYSAADVFVTLPWYEPFGITPLEAMACGTPVVGSSVGGIKFTVRDGETGYLVPPHDPDALAERLLHLARHPGLARSLGRQGIRRVHDLFSWNHVGRTMLALYDDVVVGSRRTGGRRVEEMRLVRESFDAAIEAARESRDRLGGAILEAADTITGSLSRQGKVLVAGNGGSAAEAQHLAAELVGRFQQDGRRALPAIALCADSAILTAWANDVGFERVFARQVEAYGQPGDVIVVISTSGRSKNLIAALEEARTRGLRSVALLGGGGGELANLADVAVIVPSDDTQHVQEVHGILVHVLSALVERRVAPQADAVALPAPARAAREHQRRRALRGAA
jgi:D-inositol-3-phosphate glycosyltransferase